MPDQPTPSPDEAKLAEFYGEGVSGILRATDFPTEPSSYFVQKQWATEEAVSPWETVAVYRSRSAAERFAKKWERMSPALGTTETKTGEFVPDDPQPVSAYRIVTLEDLLREGPLALFGAIFSLVTSDHEWLISTEIGDEQTIRLAADEILRDEKEG